jgi:3-hydroxybutyryl-CoA dehydratase
MKDNYKVNDKLPVVVREIDQEKIDLYAEASGDFNPLHVDPEFAKGTMFGGTIAHGMLTLAYISQVMRKFHEEGWVSGGEMEINFLAPVRPGDTITCSGEVVEVGEERVSCRVECKNQNGDTVAAGSTSVKFDGEE